MKYITTIAFCFWFFLVKGQVPCDAPLLTDVTNFCSQDAEYTNVGSTPSGFTLPVCSATPGITQDVWFRFNCIGTDISITVSGGGNKGTIKNPIITVISGDCAATQLTEFACQDATSNITQLYKAGAILGTLYYIRISTTPGNAGTFTMCVNNVTPTANPGADCEGAVKLCSKDPVTVPALKGGGKNPNEPEVATCMYTNSAFMNAEQNSCWYYWVCDQSGTLTFDLIPVDPASDIDFNLYSLTSGTDVCKNRKLEVCSATSCKLPNGATGLNMTETDIFEPQGCLAATPAASKNTYVKYIEMVSGTTYALLINNASTQSGFNISFGGTGTFLGPKASLVSDKITICPGKSIVFDGSQSLNYTSLEWNFISGNGTPVTATGVGPHTVQYNIPGDYVAILKAKDNIGCHDVSTVNFKVIEAPLITVSSDTICADQTATLTATPNVSGAIYNWLPLPLTGEGTSIITDTPGTQQTYTVSYQKEGCTNTATGTIYLNTKLDTPITVNSDSICSGDSTILSASPAIPGATYTWLPKPLRGDSTNIVTVNPSGMQTYTVTCDKDGCTATQTGTVFIYPGLTINPVAPTTICLGDSAIINVQITGGSGNYNYEWLPAGTGNTALIKVSPVASQDYTVTVTDKDPKIGKCSAVQTVIKVVVNPPLQVIATGDTICQGEQATLSAKASGGNGGPYTYTWQPSGLTGETVSVNPAVTTTYTVLVNDDCGTPVAIDSVNLEVKPQPVVNFSTKSIGDCSGEVCVNYIDSSSTAEGKLIKWQWEFGMDPSGKSEGGADTQNPEHCYTISGQYTIKLTVTNSFGCVSNNTKPLAIAINPSPKADFDAPSSVTSDASTIQFINQSVGADSWIWNFGDSFSTPDKSTSTEVHPSHNYSKIGTYCIQLTVSNIYNCVDTTTKCLTVEPIMTIYIPNAFSPNGDFTNDEFFAKGEYVYEFKISIFDRWGNLIFHSDDINEHWNGKVKNVGEIAQQDVYVFVATAKDSLKKIRKFIGTVTLVK